jgi:VanZ family protein
MVLMDTNYAAPDRPSAPVRGGLSSPVTAGVARAGLVVAVVIHVYVLYLYVPGPWGVVTVPHADKAVHAVVFALPALLGVLAGGRPRLVALVLAVHAPLSELVQHLWLPGRSGDPWDVMADWVGIALGLVVAMTVIRRRSSASLRVGREALPRR